jgi:hypothetical protein
LVKKLNKYKLYPGLMDTDTVAIALNESWGIPWTAEELEGVGKYDSPYCDGCGMCTCYGCILECGCRFNCMGDVVHKLPPAELRIRADELNRERIKGFAYFIPGK